METPEIQLNEEYLVPENIRETLRTLIDETRVARAGLEIAMKMSYHAEQAVLKIVRSAIPELKGYSFMVVMEDDNIKIQPVELSNP